MVGASIGPGGAGEQPKRRRTNAPWESGPEGWCDGRWETVWGNRSGGTRTGSGGASDLPVMGSGLIELVLRDGLRSGEIEGRGLVEVEFGLGRAAGGGDPGRSMGQVEVEEDVLHGGGESDERDDLHLTAAGGAKEREHLVDASQKLGPEHATGP